MRYELKDLEDRYELELDRIVAEIDGGNVKSVLLQLPDGLKPYGLVICDYISGKVSPLDSLRHQTGQGVVDVRIYLGDCFGACDLPSTDCDLVIQFGHAKW